MRYYTIVISDPATNTVFRTYTSFPNSVPNPNALNVELDIPTVPFATPMGGAWCRVWGVPLQEIAQSSNLNGKAIIIYGGMQKGLPLANPAQSGVLVQGFIQQAYGNWQGINQSLEMVILAGTGSTAAPKNIVLNWASGTLFADAIKNTLAVAFPDYTADINISQNLVLNHDEKGFWASVTQFAQFVKGVSQDIVGGTYQGVDIIVKQKSFIVYDGTTPTTPKAIAFTDLIGQPTWIGPLTIQVQLVMRADLQVGGYIKLPPGLVITTAQSQPQFRNTTAFQGTFQVIMIRHVGNFRAPKGDQWITTVNAVVIPNG